MSDSIAGPCVICGATDYELSLGGPTICPYCDCGRDPEIGRLISLGRKQAVEITGLRAENAVLRESLTHKGKSTFLEFVNLHEKLATVTSEKMNAITELVTYEARLKETQHVYAKTCGRLETERDDLKIALITANERLADCKKGSHMEYEEHRRTQARCAAAEKNAERYRLLRLGATNVYPIPFIAVRDPSSVVIQLAGEIADKYVDNAITEQDNATKSMINAAIDAAKGE